MINTKKIAEIFVAILVVAFLIPKRAYGMQFDPIPELDLIVRILSVYAIVAVNVTVNGTLLVAVLYILKKIDAFDRTKNFSYWCGGLSLIVFVTLATILGTKTVWITESIWHLVAPLVATLVYITYAIIRFRSKDSD